MCVSPMRGTLVQLKTLVLLTEKYIRPTNKTSKYCLKRCLSMRMYLFEWLKKRNQKKKKISCFRAKGKKGKTRFEKEGRDLRKLQSCHSLSNFLSSPCVGVVNSL